MKELHNFKALRQIREYRSTRILAFGSSNTERFLSSLHWFDGFDLALRQSCYDGKRRMHHCINAGVSGNTSLDLLERFERDAAIYKPDMVIITVGGNDANPNRGISSAQFRENLLSLADKFAEIGCETVLQTYYSVIPPATADADLENRFESFHEYMDIVRAVACEADLGLVDQLAHWEPLRLKHPELHRGLMRDDYHVNELGNRVLALHLAHSFGLVLGMQEPQEWLSARFCEALMDQLRNKSMDASARKA